MRIKGYLRLLAATFLSAVALLASESSGVVTLGGLPVPGATVTATQGDKKVTTVTDGMGAYMFADLPDGTWTVEVDMLGFAPLKQEVKVAAGAPPAKFDLQMKPLSEIQAQVQNELAPARPAEAAAASQKPAANGASSTKGKQQQAANGAAAAPQETAQAAPPAEEESGQNQKAADGLLVNGSQLNGASTPFALNPAFGNNRRGLRSLYNYNLGMQLNNSTLNARPYAQSGLVQPKAYYNNMTFTGSVGGPLRIPHLFQNGPNFTVNYQFTHNRSANIQSSLVPTQDQRDGDLSSTATPIIDPSNMLPFAGNIIPATRISPQAQALLNLYPLPNNNDPLHNYQVSLVSPQTVNAAQVRMNKQIGRKDSIYGQFGIQNIHSTTPSAFGFVDGTQTLGYRVDPTYRHQFTPRFSGTLEFQFSRQTSTTTSFFENKTNISGLAGITGNNQQPINWGPPALNFTGGILGLSDGIPGSTKPQTAQVNSDWTWNHGRHNIQFGADMRRQQFNYFTQTNPRGSFTFTGGATGSDFADFLLGIPDNASLAFGNADKYLRATGYDAYVTDDWRMNSSLTMVLGVRYEFNGTVSEKYGRLVNLDVGPGFLTSAPVLGSDPVGSITGDHYPSSLIQPEKYPFEPNIGLAWRPISGSSLIVRGGYSLRFATSPYSAIVSNMYQQSPFSTSLQVANSAATPLTLADGFIGSPAFAAQTFAVDPDFRESYAQNWNLTLQKDLPGGFQMQAGYTGIKGTRLTQFFYPLSYAFGGIDPCPTCSRGYKYEASNGNLTREAGTFELRRRLHNGFTAQATYTFAKSIDDSGTAQNWLNLSGERGLSSSDQRHSVQVSAQYTSGVGIRGGGLISGWRAALLKEWTFVVPVRWASGMPITPQYPVTLPGTGTSGVLRPEYTGASLYNTGTPGLFLNQAAFIAPPDGVFGDAGVGMITGPSQFSMGASLQRTFRVSDRLNLDLRVDGNNVLNHITASSYIAVVGNSQFGTPVINANQTRNLQTTLRFRF